MRADEEDDLACVSPIVQPFALEAGGSRVAPNGSPSDSAVNS